MDPSQPGVDVSSGDAVHGLYNPLNLERREIRVLEFTSKFEIDDEKPLECSLVTISLAAKVSHAFSAISYCWGDQTARATILISGTLLTVPASAERAVRYLHRQRSPAWRDVVRLLEPLGISEENMPFCLWIDAICINQDDPVEKASQVMLMAPLYANAFEVLIWLDEDRDGMMDRAKDALRRVEEQCREATDNLSNLIGVTFAPAPGGLVPMFSTLPLPQDLDWPAIEAFFSSKWFHRLWVVQEASLARRATCFRGEASIPLETVVMTGHWMRHRRFLGELIARDPEKYRPKDSLYATDMTLGSIYQMRNILSMMVNFGRCTMGHRQPFICRIGRCLPGFDLAFLLDTLSQYQTTVPHDKIYSTLGLLNPTTASQIKPDYSQPVARVYTEAVRLTVKESNSLQQLYSIHNREDYGEAWYRANEWPSWVPIYHLGHNMALVPMPLPGYHQVAHDLKAEVDEEQSSHNGILTLKGVCLGTVIGVSPTFNWRLMRLILDEARRCFQPVSDFTALAPQLQTNICLVEVLALLIAEGYNADEATFRHLPRPDAQMLAVWEKHAVHRCVFITDTGRLGLGPRGLRVGDDISILFGGAHVFALRGEERHWLALGACWVQDTAFGQVVQELREKGRLEEESRWYELH